MTSLPLVPDPYETSMVEVRQSSVPGAEEGLFARRDVVPDTVLAFYNGVRSQRKKDGPTTWQNEANAYKIFDPTCKEGIVNIPPEVIIHWAEILQSIFKTIPSHPSVPPVVILLRQPGAQNQPQLRPKLWVRRVPSPQVASSHI